MSYLEELAPHSSSRSSSFSLSEELCSSRRGSPEGEAFYPQLIEELCEEEPGAFSPEELIKRYDSFAEIGQLICMRDRYPEETEKRLKNGLGQEEKKWIEQKFKKELEKIRSRLNRRIKEQQREGLGSMEETRSLLLSVEIAKLAVTSSGTLNLALLLDLLSIASEWDPAIQRRCKRLLTSFAESSNLRKKFRSICKPKSPYSPSNHVIRALLGLKPETEISDVHAKQAVLSALLTDSRQASINSCFAAFLVIGLLNSHPLLCIDDLQTLLEEGKLVRTLQNIEIDLPFLLKLSSPLTTCELTPDSSLAVKTASGKRISLWKLFWVKRAMRLVGMTSSKELFRSAIAPKKALTVDSLWRQIAVEASKKSQGKFKPAPLYCRLLFYFCAQSVHPLIGIWINTVAGMAETKVNSTLRSSIVTAALITLRARLQKISGISYSDQSLFISRIYRELLEKVHLYFDPKVILPEERGREGYSGSAFVLYQKSSKLPEKWRRIDSAACYRKFICDVLESIDRDIALKAEELLINQKKLSRCLEILKNYTKKEAFIQSTISNYRSLFPHLPLKLADERRWTPWINAVGHDASLILDVYLENGEASQSLCLDSRGAEALLTSIIRLARSASEREKEKRSRHPEELTPARIPNLHAFSLLFSHPTLLPSWKESGRIDRWIDGTLLRPGLKIACSTLDQKTQEEVIASCNRKILQKLKKRLYWRRGFSSASVKAFRSELLKAIERLDEKRSLDPQSVQLKLDHCLYRALPNDLKESLMQTAVHFADTNWKERGRHLHFCFVVNPGSGRLEIWLVREDGSGMKPINQLLLFRHHAWEVFTEPPRLLRDRKKELSHSQENRGESRPDG